MTFTYVVHRTRAYAAGLMMGLPIMALSNSGAQGPLTLADVYRIAASTSRVSAATALASAAEARVASARRPSDPELQLGLMNRSLPSFAPMDPLGMTQIQLMQMIPVAGKPGIAGRIASENAAAAQSRALDVRWDVRARAAMHFYDLYAADSQLGIARQIKRLVQDIAKLAQTMYAVGDAKQADVLRAQVEIARMTEDITRMESMRAGMIARLAATLNVDASGIGSVIPPPALPDTLPPLEVLAAEAERSRPMIAAGARDVRAAEAGQKLAAREIWPDLQIGLQYAWRAGEMGTERMGSVMIGAAIPVYARSRQLRMRNEAAAMKAMAVSELANMRAETRGRMGELYADYTRARNLRALYRTTILPQADATVTSSFAAYRVGDVNLMTLLENQMTVNRYRQEVVALDAAQGKAIAEMEMLLGRELFDVSARIAQ